LLALVGFGLGTGRGFFRAGADLGAGVFGLADGLAATFPLTGVLAEALAGRFPFGAGFRTGAALASADLELRRAAGLVGLIAFGAGFAVCKVSAFGSGLG